MQEGRGLAPSHAGLGAPVRACRNQGQAGTLEPQVTDGIPEAAQGEFLLVTSVTAGTGKHPWGPGPAAAGVQGQRFAYHSHHRTCSSRAGRR